MRVIKQSLKRGMALILAFALVTGLIPLWTGETDEVQAADTYTEEKPSEGAFLSVNNFINAGNRENTHLIKFGKNGSTMQEWYVLGNDSTISGNNATLFASTPIMSNVKFNSGTGYNMDKGTWADCNYFEEIEVESVYSSHYGASTIRDTLQVLASDDEFFNNVEQQLMNYTTVNTVDIANSNIKYKTKDKMYLVWRDDNESKLYVGGDNSIEIKNELLKTR